MTLAKWLRGPTVAALAALALAGCGESSHAPWLSAGEAQVLGDELERAPATAEALDHRLKYRVGSYGFR